MPRRAKNARRPPQAPPGPRPGGHGGGDHRVPVMTARPTPPPRRTGGDPVIRLMALDVGERRIGVAISDDARRVAMPLTTLPRSADVLVTLDALAAEWDIGEIVVGLPTGLSGREGPQAAVIRAWVADAEDEISRPFRFWDERFSSLIAERHLVASGVKPDRKRGEIDAMAAAVILQGYLDAQRNRERPVPSGDEDASFE